MDKIEFENLFSDIYNETQKVENVFNNFMDAGTSTYAYCCFFSGNNYEFWRFCADYFYYNMQEFACICSRFEDEDADFFIYDGEYENSIIGYYSEKEYVNAMITYLFKSIHSNQDTTEEKIDMLNKIIEKNKN